MVRINVMCIQCVHCTVYSAVVSAHWVPVDSSFYYHSDNLSSRVFDLFTFHTHFHLILPLK